MESRIQRGNVAELIVATEASKQGHVVSMPISHNSFYDLIIDNKVRLRRIQVKRAFKSLNHGKEVLCVESCRIYGGKRRPYPVDGYDMLIAVDVSTNDLWFIPFDVAKEYKAQIYLHTKDKSRFKNDWSLL